MKSEDGIKIKVLPRGTEKEVLKQEPKRSHRGLIYVGSAGALLVLISLFGPHPRKALPQAKAKGGQANLASLAPQTPEDQVAALINRHLQDSEIKHAMMEHAREVENLQFKDSVNEARANEDSTALQEVREYGVQLDADDSADRVYDDLHETVRYSDFLPEDKINARLATRKWVNEQERAERIQFVSNFIRSAYDRGYEVEIDQNLVVVAVKPISTTHKVNINQVIDRLARQGL